MKTTALATGFLSVSLISTLATLPSAEAQRNWPQWRGPHANGSAPDAQPPLEWSESKNIKWKVKLSGEGTSTPIVWEDRIFILTAIGPEKKAEAAPAPAAPPPADATAQRPGGPGGDRPRRGGGGGGFGRSEKPTESYKFTVLCLDRKTGKTIWEKVAREEVPHEGRHGHNTFASPSPITDGKVVVAYFGSRGLYCYDMDGNLKWSQMLGKAETRNSFGEGASATLYRDKVIVAWDDEKDSDFIVAFDKNTGKELWKTPRSEPTGWSTPLVVENGNKLQVVVNATSKVRSYDLETGKEIWSAGGQTANAIPTPVADKDTVYVTSGFRGSALHAIKLGQTGDLTGTEAIRWSKSKSTPYVPSPLLTDGSIYVVSGNNAILSSFDTKDGNPHFEAERLEGLREIYASPVATKDRVYVLGRDGDCFVLKKGPKLEVIAKNKLEDKTDASIALVGNELFIRGLNNLYCIAEK